MTYQYKYDKFGRLLVADNSVSSNWDMGVGQETVFDANGNIVKMKYGALAKTYAYYTGTNKIKNTDGSGNDYVYDNIGNVTKSTPKTIDSLFYDPFINRTKQISKSTSKMTFQYDGTERRVYKKDSTSAISREFLYLYDGLNAVAVKRKGGGTSEYVYGPTGLIAANINGTWYFVLKDHLGSARTIVDQSGTTKVSIDYAPYGAIIRTSGSPNIAYQFTGQEYDSTSGLWNYKARMYDAELGVFYAMDPAGQYGSAYIFNRNESTKNKGSSEGDSVEINEIASPFLYSGNNPIRYADRNGELFIIDDYAIGFVKGLAKGKNPFKTGWKHAQNSALIWGGLFQGNPKQILSRFTWELPQTIVGFTSAHGSNMFYTVKSVKYYDGATVLRTKGDWGAFTIGSYIVGDNSIRAKLNNPLFMHEYGHYLQSQSSGLFYLPKYGIPSLWNAAANPEKHHRYWVEKDANLRAYEYFRGKDGFDGWNFGRYPLANRKAHPWFFEEYIDFFYLGGL